MAADRTPGLRELLRRAWRVRCPACGVGAIFQRGGRGVVRCPDCGWKLLRDEGHWLGGIEINLLCSLLLGTAATVTLGVYRGFDFWTALCGGLFTLLFSAWFYGRSRALFYALDYYFDPQAEDAARWDDDGGWHALLRDEPAAPAPSGGLEVDLAAEEEILLR